MITGRQKKLKLHRSLQLIPKPKSGMQEPSQHSSSIGGVSKLVPVLCCSQLQQLAGLGAFRDTKRGQISVPASSSHS